MAARFLQLLLLFPCLVAAQTSTFDFDNEGWTTNGDALNWVAFWESTGGTPDGCIRGLDLNTGLPWNFVAPPCFTGNKSALYNDTLEFDFRTDFIGSTIFNGQVILVGPNGKTLFHNMAQVPKTTWTHFVFRLNEANFNVGSPFGVKPTLPEFKAVLANLTSLQIRGEYYTGVDQGYLDNVRLGRLARPNIDTIVCGDTYLFGNQSFTQPGTFDFIYTTGNGCDSAAVHLELQFEDSSLVWLAAEICEGDRYEFPDGSAATESGRFVFQFPLPGGCDSTVVVDLKMHPSADTTLEIILHEGEFFTLPDGSTVGDADLAGNLFFEKWYPFQTVFGCDSTIRVRVKTIFYRLFFPNIFSPDDDGQNDFWMPLTSESVEKLTVLKIFDRWGNLVFEQKNSPPNNLAHAWNGSFRGKKLRPGVFTWLAEAEFIDGKRQQFQGSVTIK